VTDLATLSLKIDSSGMDGGIRKLADMVSKSEAVEGAAAEMARSIETAVSRMVADFQRANAGITSVQDRINRMTGVKGDFGTSERAADIAAYGKQLDDLRAKYNPLFDAQRRYRESLDDINQAARLGAISELERANAIAATKAAFASQVTSLQGAGTAARLTAFQYQQLGFQINDIATGLAMGQSPFQVMAQQGGQVYQVLGQGPGGVGGALRALGGTLGGLATSSVAVFGAATAAAVGFGLAISKITDDQRNLERALSTGLGRGAGLSPDQFRETASAAANAAQVSKSAAEEIALAFAQTGKIGGAMFGDLIVLASRFGLTVGSSAQDAAKELGKAFADPVRGMEQLEKRVGTLDDATRQYVRNAVAVGDTFGAQQALARGLNAALVQLPQRIETIGDAWTRLKNAVSDGASALLGIASLTERIKAAEAELANFQRSQGSGFGASEARIRQSMEKLSKLLEEQAQADAKASAAAETLRKNEEAARERALQDRIKGYDLEIKAIGAKTDVEKAAIAGEQAYLQAIQSGMTVRQAKVEQLYAEEKAMASLKASIDQTIRSMQDQTAASNIGAGILNMGGGMGAATAAMEKYTQLAQLQREIDAADGQAKADLEVKYRALAAAIDENTAARARMQAAQSMEALNNEAAILRMKISLHGEENSYIEKKIALLQVEQQIKAAGLDPTGMEANEWRRKAEEVQNLKSRLEELNATQERGVGSAQRYASAMQQVTQSLFDQALAIQQRTGALTTMYQLELKNSAFSNAKQPQTYKVEGPYQIGVRRFDPGGASFGRAPGGSTTAMNDNRISELQTLIKTLERNIDKAEGRWDNYQPSAYAEKNPLLFYDFQSGNHFTAAERAQIKKMEDQLSVAQKQLAELQKLNSKSSSGKKSSPGNWGSAVGFATGGSFMVGGSGGTDTTPVSFMATPGERVTVETPAQQRSNAQGGQVVNDNRDQRTIHVTVQVVADPNSGGDKKLMGDRAARDIAERLRRIA
jgi:phage-related minor tail protein